MSLRPPTPSGKAMRPFVVTEETKAMVGGNIVHLLNSFLACSEFEHVMISDLRDVIFQRDPFDTPVASLELFLEDPAVTFATAGFNQRWVADLYGADAAARLGNMVVSCSGVSFGTRDGMIEYLEEMGSSVRDRMPRLTTSIIAD